MKLDHTLLLGLRAQFDRLLGGNETAGARKAVNTALGQLLGPKGPKTAPDYLGSMTDLTSLVEALLGSAQIKHPKGGSLLNGRRVELLVDGRSFSAKSREPTIALGAALVDALIDRNERHEEPAQAAEVTVSDQGNRPADAETGEPKVTPSRGSSRPTGFTPGAQARQAGSTTGSKTPPGYKAPPSHPRG